MCCPQFKLSLGKYQSADVVDYKNQFGTDFFKHTRPSFADAFISAKKSGIPLQKTCCLKKTTVVISADLKGLTPQLHLCGAAWPQIDHVCVYLTVQAALLPLTLWIVFSSREIIHFSCLESFSMCLSSCCSGKTSRVCPYWMAVWYRARSLYKGFQVKTLRYSCCFAF